MSSLNILSAYNQLGTLVDIVKKYSTEMNLVPVIHAYLEDKIISNVVKSLETIVRNLYEQYKFERTMFIKNALKSLNFPDDNLPFYPYYTIPISEETIVKFIDNSSIPPKAIIIQGEVRFTFMLYSSFSELEEHIRNRQDEDIIVKFEDGKVTKYDRRRNIFTDANVVSKIVSSKSQVAVNLTLPKKYYLVPSLLAMNVIPNENKVIIRRKNEDLNFEIVNGKVSSEKVMSGETLNPKFKLEIYYDYKSKRLLSKEDIIKGLISKII